MQPNVIESREDGHMLITLQPDMASVLRRLLRQTVTVLEAPVPWWRPGARRIRRIRRRMFPDAYPRKTDSDAFRRRYDAEVRSAVATATRQVLSGCHEARTIELDRPALAAWFVGLGAVRWLYLDRTGTVNTERRPRISDATIATWLRCMHDALAQTLEPEAFAVIQQDLETQADPKP
jgi:hypothetical protein